MLSVSRPMLVVVLNDWVIDTKLTGDLVSEHIAWGVPHRDTLQSIDRMDSAA
ncbi:hypothetical protein M9978_13895 [Sphingomonas sp. MG17]|uniref:Uncharacterized protein n=1 Tax=Sphingomonas tagetis TaxID=2949092 RepID=A0A9X2KMB4_9SPHN|nr:hypothetical protein [Sphingomonas tagetis]MCP3731517.1 hypothetical protein [Sphingomonas tagetis]